MRRMDRHDGTHANRLIPKESSQCFIGPFAIGATGNVRPIKDLFDHRLTSTFRHLADPANRVYMLTMEGLLFEVDVATLKATEVANVLTALNIKARPHCKGGFTAQGRIVIANNGFYNYGDNDAGLFEYDGKSWRVLSRKPHMDVAARQDMGQVMFCTGWDEMSVLLSALVEGKWQPNTISWTYRVCSMSYSQLPLRGISGESSQSASTYGLFPITPPSAACWL